MAMVAPAARAVGARAAGSKAAGSKAGPKLLGSGEPPVIKAHKVGGSGSSGGSKKRYKSSGYQSEYSRQYARRQREYTRQHYKRQYANYRVRSRLQQERQADIFEEYNRRQRHYAVQAGRRRLYRAGTALGQSKSLGRTASKVASPAEPVINPLLLIVMLWGAILILYVMITTPGPTSGFFASLRSWVSTIYTSQPLFLSGDIAPRVGKISEKGGFHGGSTTMPPSSSGPGTQQG